MIKFNRGTKIKKKKRKTYYKKTLVLKENLMTVTS